MDLEEIKGVLGTEEGRASLLTTLSLTIKILPYFGYADQCRTLMTQLRSESRQLWLSNEDQWLKPLINGQEEEVFHIQKRNLWVENLKGPSNSDDEVSPDSQMMELIHAGTYKLYSLIFCLDDENLSSLETIANFCQIVDPELLKVGSMYISTLINKISNFEFLMKISKALQIEVKEYKVDKATYYQFKNPPFIIFNTSQFDGAKNLYVCSDDWNLPDDHSEQMLIDKMRIGFLELPELVELLTELLEIMTTEALSKKIEDSDIKIKLHQDNIVRDKGYIQELSRILESLKFNEEGAKGSLPNFGFLCEGLFKDEDESMQPNDLDVIPLISNTLNNKGLPTRIAMNRANYEKPTKYEIKGANCLISYNNWAMKATNFYLRVTTDYTIDGNCIVFGSNENAFYADVNEKASFNDLEEHKSLSQDLKIYIPFEEITSVRCNLKSLSRILSVGSVQKLSNLDIKIDPTDLSEEDFCEIVQSIPKSTKTEVEIIDPGFENNQQEQSNDISFKALHNLSLEELRVNYEISNKDSLSSLISLLKQQTALNTISVKIRASEIEDANLAFKSLLGAICSTHCLYIDISVSESTPEMANTSKQLVKDNITKDISISLNPLPEKHSPTKHSKNTSYNNSSPRSQKFLPKISIEDHFKKLQNKFK
ncbi:unnamed protein product [Moneuplotes crassus]|uniref:Uncharacterized protein n=1 Tax=Euplotes crassus TaxID=5936 RepID=A0AAD1X8I4_EUPCR|nr:unnamed protein product [Moneuplotes crassus]